MEEKDIRFEQRERPAGLKTGTKGKTIKAVRDMKEDTVNESKEGNE